RRAGLAEHLEAALELAAIIGAERTGEGPGLLRRGDQRIVRRAAVGMLALRAVRLRHCRPGREQHAEADCRQSLEDRIHCVKSLGASRNAQWPDGAVSAAGSAAVAGFCFASTASVMEFGIRRGVSMRPSSGMTTMKKAK